MAMTTETLTMQRFGYGFRPGERPSAGAEGLMDQLRAPDPMTPGRLPTVPELDAAIARRRDAIRDKVGADSDAALKAARAAIQDMQKPLTARRITAPVLSPQGFRERLVAFWADHFTVITQGIKLGILGPVMIETAIRSNVTGSFGDMLVACSLDPAMMMYLDQFVSFGPGSPIGQRRDRGLNENLAREILELHTLGVGGPYTQDDVRELAKLLTGHGVLKEKGAVFIPGRAEPGAETVLGKSYGSGRPDPDDAVAVLRDLARHPATARHIARKLVVHFVSDDPDPALVDHVAAAWTGEGDLMAVYAALVEHPASWSTDCVKARQPLDFYAAALRAFDVPNKVKNFEQFAAGAGWRHLNWMGQTLMRPQGPNGWPEEPEAWLNPPGLAGRVRVAGFLAQRFGGRLDPRAFLEETLREAPGETLTFAVSAAETKWEGLALTLLSPEFNRR